MSQNFANVAQTIWDPLFETKLQNTENLKDTVRVYSGVEGTTYNRRLGTKGEMMQVGYNASNIPVTTINYSQTAINLYAFAYKTVVAERELVQIGTDGPSSAVLQEEAEAHAMALGRYQDYLKLQAIYSDTSRFTTIPKTSGATTGLNVNKIVQARQTLQYAGLIMPEMYGAISADLQTALAADEHYSSFFFNTTKPLPDMNTGIPTPEIGYYGVKMRVLGGNGINSLPYTVSGSNKTYNVPVWSKDVITAAMSVMGPKTNIWYNPGEGRYEILTQLIMGVGVTQNNGVVLVACDTANTSN